MRDFANRTVFESTNILAAQKGILGPRRRELTIGTVMVRFGNTSQLALEGGWWLEGSQLLLVKNWALQNSLSLPHAVRVLCAIAHEYGSMEVCVRVRTVAPLLAYEGLSLKQARGGNEYLNPQDAQYAPKINQLFVPGLWDRMINARSIICLSSERFAVGASHIGGVPGFPKNAIIQ